MQNRKARKELNRITISYTYEAMIVYQVGNKFFPKISVGGSRLMNDEYTSIESIIRLIGNATITHTVHYDSFVEFESEIAFLQLNSRSRLRKEYFGDVLPKMYRNITKLKRDYMIDGYRITNVQFDYSKKTFGVYYNEQFLENNIPLYATVDELERAGYISKIRPHNRFCKECGRVIDHQQKDVPFCDRCAPRNGYVHCRNCYKWHKESELQLVGVYEYCQKCIDRMTPCVCCGKLCFSKVCNTCRDTTHSMIKSYSHKPNPKMLHNGDNGRFFGLEIELSFAEEWERIKFLVELSNTKFYKEENVYCKSDGSISDYGVEVVTHPMTHDFIFKNADFLDFADVLYKYGKINESCGGHIHTNRNVLQSDTDTKICYLFNKYPEACENKCDRNDLGDLEQWASPSYDCKKECTFDYFMDNADFEERYQALNLKNSKTIEFRLFSSTTDLDVIISRIEWIERLITLVESKDVDQITMNELL